MPTSPCRSHVVTVTPRLVPAAPSGRRCGSLAVLFGILSLPVVATAEDAWSMFRGPNGTAAVADAGLPNDWGVDRNLKWSLELPGPGASSPIVWDNHVFVTTYEGYGEDAENPGTASSLVRHLLCVDRETGREAWRQTVRSTADEDPYEGFITEHGFASSTPVTNGKAIFAFFGKSGVHAFEREGQPLWNTSVGTESDPAKWGGGTSPLLFEDLVIVNAGNEGSAIVALHQIDGSEAWRYADPMCKNSWSTPLLVKTAGRVELVVSIPGKILALDPRRGSELWYCESPIESTVVPSVISKDGVVYSMGSRAGRALAVKCGGSGDVSQSQVLWQASMPAGISTPVIVGDRMYWASTGILLSVDLATGKDVQRERLPAAAAGSSRSFASNYSSPIAVGSKVYLLMRSGVTHVFETQPELGLVQSNRIVDDAGPFDGTPAVAGRQLFFRSTRKLYCIEAGSPAP